MEHAPSGCDSSARVCGDICPTNALRKLTLEKKNTPNWARRIDQSRCLFTLGKNLPDRRRGLPYNAIIFKTVGRQAVPVIVPSRCNGCGWCEDPGR